MSGLPEILVPQALPPIALVTSHTRASVYADSAMGTGAARRRRMATSKPRQQAVRWMLSGDEMTVADAWFENTLVVGTKPFAVQLPSPALLEVWWTAQWLAPYAATPIAGNGYWEVTGTLLLTGQPSVTGPVPTSAAVEFTCALWATAEAYRDAHAEVEFEMALTGLQLAEVEFEMALVVPKYYAREDSGYIEREDGTPLLREN